MPINLATICAFYKKFLTPEEAKGIIQSEANLYSNSEPANFEEKIIAAVGKPLYESLFKGYTVKQWQKNPKELPPEIAGRLPVRFTFNNNYFDDTWEGIPIKGYTGWINSMADNKNINIILNTDFFKIKNLIKKTSILVYTGPIDRYFEYNGGLLNWRTLDFETEVKNLVDFQGTSVINYADEEVPHTRIHEFKHLHPERRVASNKTVIMKEFSRKALKADEPYYPVNSNSDRKKLSFYRKQIQTLPKTIIFGGRLGSYLYLDMHMAIASALNVFENEVKPLLTESRSK
jgi:UDP-galactopyranose mutase